MDCAADDTSDGRDSDHFVFPVSSRQFEIDEEPWVPPYEAVGEDGFVDSEDPLCTRLQSGLSAFSVWSDPRGVFALVAGGDVSVPASLECLTGNCDGAAKVVYQNDGTGWTSIYHEVGGTGTAHLTLRGFEQGPLVLVGQDDLRPLPGCGLSTIDDGNRICEPILFARDAFVVHDSLAYAIAEGDILRYDGDGWGPISALLPEGHQLTKLWATESVVFATTAGLGKILTLQDGAWRRHETGTVEQFSAIWGFSDTDVWAGTAGGGIFHFDGSDWTEAARLDSADACNAVMGLWGVEDVLYAHTANTLARVDTAQAAPIEILERWDCADEGPTIRSLWGDGPDQVFLALADFSRLRQSCGVTFVVHFDGAELHRF